MPRASGLGKRQQGAAGHRETRHENGLVGPAKRASGKKSNGQPDGPARPADCGAGQAGPSVSSSSLPSAAQSTANGVTKHHADAVSDSRAGDERRRSSVGAYSETSSDSSTSNVGGSGNGVVESGHRQIDVNAMKNSDVHRDSGPFELAATVLKSLPIQDTLAILIILMQVPSLSLSIVYGMFTFLTFVPPVTTSSGMNINFAEMFDGNSTMPSLITVLCMDSLFLLIWLFLWQPIQDVILDFAKPVIAITLGGGTSARDGTSRGVTTCFTYVVVHHLLRGTRAHWSRLVRHIPEKWHVPAYLRDPLESVSSVYDKRNAYGWVRSVLAIHILTQGVVRYIREWYLRREKVNALSGMSDPEAGKPQTGPSDGANEAGFNTPDTEATPHPSTTKKRRKQSTQVRLQQPLWAALASTKIVMMKEYELSHAASETKGSNATDIHNLGNAPFDTKPGQIWISYIGSDEVCFSTSHFPDIDYETNPPPKANGHAARPAGIDASKPFYVRVNNAYWQPTRIFPVEDTEDPDDDSLEGTRWTGDIYGLRPASKYVCEFVDSQSDKILFSTSIRTVQEPLRESDGGAPAVADGQQSLRPDSPATTLKTSIAAAEAKLADEKNRLKTLRKEWKTRINALKRDNELTDNQLSSAGSHDEKYKQKVRQQETQKAQAERETELLAEQLKNFDTAPELIDRKKKMEKAYTAEKKVFDTAQKGFKEFKSKLEKEIKAKEVESANLNTRRNKIATRIAKVENELANITDANNRGLDEAERRKQERVIWQDQVSGIEANYNERLAHVRATNAARSEHIRNAQAQLSSFHEFLNSANGMPYDAAAEAFQQHHTQQQINAGHWNANPIAPAQYPTGMWAGSSSDLLPPTSSAGGMPSTAAWHPPPTAPPFEPRGLKARGRSSSMLSDVSGFTQSSEEDVTVSPIGAQRARQLWASRLAGNGSSGSSGSGSGSVGDPTSPT